MSMGKVKGGYRWSTIDKVYPAKEATRKQSETIKASRNKEREEKK